MADDPADDPAGETDRYDVVVVGGGPVGIASALMCARQGLSVVVLERTVDVYDLPRAIVMDDEVQRAFHVAGVGEGLAAVTSPVPGAEFIDAAGTQIIGMDLRDLPDTPLGHHPVVRYYQPELEVFLRDAAAAAGAVIELGVDVARVEADGTGVTAVLAGGRRRVRGDWLIAADGASSPIRKSLGIAFEDQGFDQEWLVVDIELRDGVDDRLPVFVQQICDPQRPVTFVPGHRRYRRWEFQLQPGETRDEMLDPVRVWELLAPWVGPDEARLVRSAVYRFHALVAARLRAGRVLIAGDAGHQMPPFLGQGLCAGVRDAVNLAWKVALVQRGVADPVFLDTYDAERRPHAAGVVAHAVDTGRLIDQLAGRTSAGVDLDSAYGGQRPFPHLTAGFVTGAHPFVGRQVPNPRLPDGARLDDVLGDGFAVVLPAATASEFEGAALDRWRTLGAVVVEAPVSPIAGSAGAIVVRPDRYIAAVADDAATFAEHTEHLFAMFGPTSGANA
jgi:3-(3-hydroxy-phenyl)propionate hydroxylase